MMFELHFKGDRMSHDIFISYSRRDTETMIQVSDSLRAAGLKVWTDEGIEPGTESWKHALSSAIKSCKLVVVLFSPDSAESTWVHRELDFAEVHRKKIYPLLLRGEPENAIPFGYTTFQFIDIRHDHKVQEGLQKLIDTLREHLDNMPETAPAQAVLAPEFANPQPEEVLWKWVETDEIRMTLPHTARVSPPDEANMQRIVRLLYRNDDKLILRYFQNMERLGSVATNFPGIKTRYITLFSDVSNLSPIAGIVFEFRAWYFVPFMYFIAPYITQPQLAAKKLGDVLGYETSDVQWHIQSAARVCSGIARTTGNEGMVPITSKTYIKLFPAFRKILLVQLSCEQSQFARNEPMFDQMAKSLVYS
jgi:hypothetical protein